MFVLKKVIVKHFALIMRSSWEILVVKGHWWYLWYLRKSTSIIGYCRFQKYCHSLQVTLYLGKFRHIGWQDVGIMMAQMHLLWLRVAYDKIMLSMLHFCHANEVNWESGGYAGLLAPRSEPSLSYNQDPDCALLPSFLCQCYIRCCNPKSTMTCKIQKSKNKTYIAKYKIIIPLCHVFHRFIFWFQTREPFDPRRVSSITFATHQ